MLKSLIEEYQKKLKELHHDLDCDHYYQREGMVFYEDAKDFLEQAMTAAAKEARQSVWEEFRTSFGPVVSAGSGIITKETWDKYSPLLSLLEVVCLGEKKEENNQSLGD